MENMIYIMIQIKAVHKKQIWSCFWREYEGGI